MVAPFRLRPFKTALFLLQVLLIYAGMQWSTSMALLPPSTTRTTRITFARTIAPTTRTTTKENGSCFHSTAFRTRRVAGSEPLYMSSNDSTDPTDPTSGIINTLERIDKLRRLEQNSKPRSRWSRLVLKDDSNTDEESTTVQDEYEFDPVTGAPIPRPPKEARMEADYVYLLEPPNFSTPSCIIVFIGGAGLGSFPQVSYQEFLMRISDRMNAAVITAPYNVLGLDHFQLAKAVGEKSRRALLQCEEDPERMYNPNLPVYCIAHSLGCKLASIYMAATGQEYDGMGFIGFNNYGFARTISMAKDFAQTIQESSLGGGGRFGVSARGATTDTFNGLFSMAESLLGSFGVEFSPSPVDTERLISMKFDERRISKTRLFVLDEDNLDDSESFLRGCAQVARRPSSTDMDNDDDDSTTALPCRPQLSALPGNHLAPVYFEFDLNNPEIPESAREVARSRLGGFESASFGNKQDLEALVEEVVGFLLGRPPSRTPPTASPPLLSSASTTSE